MSSADSLWPSLVWDEWKDTADTLHMWTQIVGHTRLVLCAPQNHWWQVTLYVTSRGLTTSPMPWGNECFDAEFDFIDHRLVIRLSSGPVKVLSLRPQSVADFYREYMAALASFGIHVTIHSIPDEVANPIPFAEDTVHASYDPDAAHRFWRILMQSSLVFRQFQTNWLGKASPVHFFWGSFDLAVTRFSGRRAPERPRADPVTREAYSHEVISFGFWPGNGGYGQPAFYAYAAPEPAGFGKAAVRPAAAFYSDAMKEYLLNYEDVRKSASTSGAILEFMESVYRAGSANWDHAALERSEPFPARIRQK
ncbi:MAG TPA: DUF5996 family protein [Alloacidobacterium sp.]|nr:DUF5996 family protein [Alloacidobacterium sp.]